jgi:hypothetical protein
MNNEALLPAASTEVTDGQRLFVRYFTATLIDLVVLGLCAEYWPQYVKVDTFTTALLAALVLQLLLKATIHVEHLVAGRFKGKTGGLNTFLRFFCAWLVLFGSKFVILEAISMLFGEKVWFGGPWHGIVVLIGVIVVMLVAEEVVVRIYRRLGRQG